jgi:Tfp pilus assembly protein PilP|tara:strand:+ start:5889 stop:6299 length:411 start_codon:yes stop_codon:yes gene_type:complete
MKNKLKIFSIALIVLISFENVSNAENAFTPLFEPKEAVNTVVNSPVALDIDSGVHPLLQYEVQDYILMAVIVSKKIKLGLIRANNGGEYFIKIDDLLGKSEGKIIDITGQGILVSENNKVVLLNVRNRSASNENIQ